MSTSPLVSFIITVHNEGDMLREAIESVLAQTYPHIEIIVVDDGSNDPETLEILKRFETQGIATLYQPNKGLPAARNAGILASAGEFFFPLDADDKLEPSYCERAITAYRENPDLGIVYSRANLFGAETGTWDLVDYTGQPMLVMNLIPACCFYRRIDWERVGGYCEELVHGLEDFDFNLSILDIGRQVLKLDEYFFWYRKREGSLSKGHGDRRDLAHTLATIMRRHPERYLLNAEYLFKELIELRDEVRDFNFRYEFFEKLRRFNSPLFVIAKSLRKILDDWSPRKFR